MKEGGYTLQQLKNAVQLSIRLCAVVCIPIPRARPSTLLPQQTWQFRVCLAITSSEIINDFSSVSLLLSIPPPTATTLRMASRPRRHSLIITPRHRNHEEGEGGPASWLGLLGDYVVVAHNSRNNSRHRRKGTTWTVMMSLSMCTEASV